MHLDSYKRNWVKFIIGLLVCFSIRLIPFRAPNVEPVMATQMPFAKQYGWLAGFMFGFFSIVFFDIVTSGIGVWTWVTAIAYGLVGVGAYAFLKNRRATALQYVAYGIIGTLAYDAVTGIGMGTLLFHQSFMQTVLGQIPFTAMHLAGNVVFSFLLSPAIYKWVVKNEQLDWFAIRERLTALVH
ncbi:MAG: hypothetical protein COV41_02880 [Candidatus Brennerbacteria bacterium CG11_big_fil_rev_8_21_14_0_20_43_10]|uniref:ECF transporter S component n=2 Tax=Candidatus Brenneribacteriota TaxID=1817902 RepID=A0A2H9N7K7_9BACT|nr:MAG: hypothetical protein COX12_00150 [Candidatus Brennerbacteria bacterium CG23_combo_of_CG06-09_8_20_14_all_44_41]PIR25427.1 MAG: hypothetical protein COV41_02880 [Candidatus Brennerbacteria bacterium CG11_big_fil_rev_8_21_14_0_20_43_10]PIX29341.1 MAG: hypothetical protein COZ64_00250 [Candidatus Brennerbacteria bacterium CG_4_8_14_3_um_filter_43_14]PJA19434.1 MAG: hypothetical protein COX61_01090 [Candidatus Brennerbacteria bacterium CG_4_10_14_0_2_um_filter_43_14]